MKRWTTLVVIVLVLAASSALAQRSFQFRVGLPDTSLGFGLEATLQRNLSAGVYGDLFLNGARFLLGGNVLFKPDLGQFDRDLRGISPYIGGGLAVPLTNAGVAFTLDAGIEFDLDRSTGFFIGGQGLYFVNGGNASRVILGASFR